MLIFRESEYFYMKEKNLKQFCTDLKKVATNTTYRPNITFGWTINICTYLEVFTFYFEV